MSDKKRMDRNKAVPALVGNPDDFLIVAGLAGPAKDIGYITDKAFLFGGAMGGAVMAGLGLALAQPDKKVLCVTGDGDLLMSLGSLATVGVMKLPNFSVVCVDNALYQETGGANIAYRAWCQPCRGGCRLRLCCDTGCRRRDAD